MSQQRRVVVAFGYSIGLILLSWVVLGDPVPDLGASGTWFYAGLAMLLLSAALTEPFFATPAQSLGNAIAALLVAVAFPVSGGGVYGAVPEQIGFGKTAVSVVAATLIAVSLGAILTKDRVKTASLSAALARCCRNLGSARTIYSILFLASSYALYASSTGRLVTLFLSWFLIFHLKPLEAVASITWKGRFIATELVGVVTRLRHPGLVEVLVRTDQDLALGDEVGFEGTEGSGLVLDVGPSEIGRWALLTVMGADAPQIGESVIRRETSETKTVSFVGPVEPGTNLTEILMRVPGNIGRMREGNLVSVDIRGQKLLYQIVAARVRSEKQEEGVEHRYLEVAARKIGAWDSEDRAFRRVPWLPVPGSPVTLEAPATPEFQTDSVGRVPDSTYGIRVDPDLLVTHNTAILGILGIGKTFLAFELIRRVLESGIKVIVFDITGQYAPHFRDIFPEWYEQQSVSTIQTAIAANRNRVTQNVHEGGNIQDFRDAVSVDLRDFLDGDYRLKVYNPGGFDVVRQDSKPFQGVASMAPLTMVETTRILAEELLHLMSTEITDKAKICLVLEEAHSLVPEWNSTTYAGDQQASNGTAKAVLQGRKYGLGVLLITQRTANVTKTVLNQCNTVFALRIFDATGMEFLRNYIGDAYADVLSSLEDRTAVIFGRASSCPSPVLIRVNDHEEMISGFWNEVRKQIPVPPEPEVGDL